MKKHKGLLICLGVLIILGVVAFFGLKKLVYPDGSKNKYGDRLNGIENYSISDQSFIDMKESFTKNENVIDFSYNIQGKIVKIFVKVKKDTKVEDAENLSDIITKNLTEEQLKFYDILYYITCEEENELYPIVGSRHKTSEIFSWTIKQKVEEEEEVENVDDGSGARDE